MATLLLFESASGFALFEKKENEEIGASTEALQQSLTDFSRFSRIVSLKSFHPFESSDEALQNIKAVAEGSLHETLKGFLELNLNQTSTTASKKGKKSAPTATLGVCEERLAQNIHDQLSVKCDISQGTQELLRGIRLFFSKFIQNMTDTDASKAQLGLGHSYSRSKVQFNVNRVDNMIIQSISLLDQLDKDINTFAMRVREWYSWHFPELIKIVPDNTEYARVVNFIKNKNSLTDESVEALEALLDHDEQKAKNIVQASKSSMGMDISDFDLSNIETFAQRVVALSTYRKHLQTYLSNKLKVIAPNLSALLGDAVAARLISHSGSLTNLAKCPASTIQILGAEKALFRALKTRGKTPKYGLLFHSTFIGRATLKNKGRISRYLANKSAIAARLDSFSEIPTNKFGERLREQVEERLSFYETGKAPTKNIDAMKEVLDDLAKTPGEKRKAPSSESMDVESPKKKAKKEKKVKEVEMKDESDEEEKEEKETPKKKKKAKKADAEEGEEKETPKKKKKVKKEDTEDEEKETPKKKAKKEDAAEGDKQTPKKKKAKKDDVEDEDEEKQTPKKKKKAKKQDDEDEEEKTPKKKKKDATPKKEGDDEKPKKKKKADDDSTPKKKKKKSSE